jgi:NAD(P)-dependent dehydrogenase (short-subunit alcohol dehydrogenase family)
MSKQPIALITGAAGGIGKALVAAFTELGYRVVGLDQVAKPSLIECWHYLQVDLQRMVADSRYAESQLELIKELVANVGLNTLINNAAVQVLGGVSSLNMNDWQKTLNVNLLAPFVLTQGLLSELEAANGCVINMSSIHARLTKPNFLAYATSKAALSGMTRAMAVDLAGRVRVNAIEPAAIATEMLKAGFINQPEKLTQLESCHPQGRIGTPAEVAALALSMASGDMQFMHGACVGLDGGISGRLHDPS